jgi:NhaA family Na+:H+ antiporter
LSGIALGLIVTICFISLVFLAVSTKICKLPPDMNWKTVIGVGLGGIGLMSIFFFLLYSHAFDDKTIIQQCKFIILLSSLIAGCDFVFLKNTLK